MLALDLRDKQERAVLTDVGPVAHWRELPLGDLSRSRHRLVGDPIVRSAAMTTTTAESDTTERHSFPQLAGAALRLMWSTSPKLMVGAITLHAVSALGLVAQLLVIRLVVTDLVDAGPTNTEDLVV